MGQISGHNRKGFTILEESIVIAIIALLAIPLVTLLNESIRAQVYGTKDVKGQYYANLIMQDFERRVRQAKATTNSIAITTGNPYKVNFTYEKTDKDGKKPLPVTYKYKIDNPNTEDSLFYRDRDDGNGWQVFPTGLEKGIIKNFELVQAKSHFDVNSENPPYYITIKITTSAGTILQKTIYLVNYYKQK